MHGEQHATARARRFSLAPPHALLFLVRAHHVFSMGKLQEEEEKGLPSEKRPPRVRGNKKSGEVGGARVAEEQM
jgi:hypothetical protein